MAIKTTAEQLEEVQTAITAVMSGQAVTLDGMALTRASLDSLQKREEYLRNKYDKEQGKRPFRKSTTFGGMGY